MSDFETIRFQLEEVRLRMQLRIDSGKENVAIGQLFAKDIVRACEAALNYMPASDPLPEPPPPAPNPLYHPPSVEHPCAMCGAINAPDISGCGKPGCPHDQIPF